MTRSRVQTNRNLVTGATPSTGVRKPGEFYVNFPDRQIGFIDAAQTPQDALAVRFFSPLANYPIGVFVVNAGALYVSNSVVFAGPFDATSWTRIGP